MAVLQYENLILSYYLLRLFEPLYFTVAVFFLNVFLFSHLQKIQIIPSVQQLKSRKNLFTKRNSETSPSLRRTLVCFERCWASWVSLQLTDTRIWPGGTIWLLHAGVDWGSAHMMSWKYSLIILNILSMEAGRFHHI